jgi:hypothetical protein
LSVVEVEGLASAWLHLAIVDLLDVESRQLLVYASGHAPQFSDRATIVVESLQFDNVHAVNPRRAGVILNEEGLSGLLGDFHFRVWMVFGTHSKFLNWL